MNRPIEPRENRREALRGLACGGALGALTLLGVRLLVRPKQTPGGRCRQVVACRECPALARCGLPRAVQFKMSVAR